ncbi:hypothetical protein BH10PSE6_BH10PSE6_35520 [soil metagenome]
MTGELIRFDRHSRRGDLYRQQPVPHGTAHGVRHSSVVELQVARIARLLTELDELTRVSENVPAAPLDQVRADLVKARRVITPWTAGEQRPAGDDEGDPQPDVDDERLEWMYRELNRDA